MKIVHIDFVYMLQEYLLKKVSGSCNFPERINERRDYVHRRLNESIGMLALIIVNCERLVAYHSFTRGHKEEVSVMAQNKT